MRFYHSIRFKLLLILVLIVVIPAMISGGLMLGELRNRTGEQSRRILGQEFKQAVVRFDEILFEVESYAPTVYADERLLELINRISPDMKDYEYLQVSNRINSLLFGRSRGNNYLRVLDLEVGDAGSRFSSDHQRRMIYPDGALLNVNEWRVSRDDDDFTYLSLSKEIRDFRTHRLAGTVTFNVFAEHLRDQLNEYINEKYSVFVYTADESSVLSLRSEMLNLTLEVLASLSKRHDEFLAFTVDGNRYLGLSYRSPHSKLLFIGVIPQEHLFGDLQSLWNLSVLALFTVLAVAVTGIVIGSRGMFQDLDRLYEGLHRLGGGEFNFSITTRRKDEIGYIIKKVNDMAGNISSLIDEVYRKELLRNQVQLKAIQIEINEHFLYNTLDLVRWMCDEGQTREASQVVQKLSSYFRFSLNDGQDVIPVSSVAQSLESYRDILAIRSNNRYSVHIQVEEGLGERHVLKYLFQPLLENAVIHGMDPLPRAGRVDLRFYRDEEYLCFSCRDNGIGIDDAAMGRIHRELAAIGEGRPVNPESYGISNIASQIRLHYGETGEFDIRSTEGEGTDVVIRIPFRQTGRREAENEDSDR